MSEAPSIVEVDVTAPRQTYDIVIGTGLLAETGILIKNKLGVRRCLIVTDTQVGPLYSQTLAQVLIQAGHSVLTTLTVAAGEASKDFSHLQILLDQMLATGLDRKTLIIALGGGVIGDLAGLAASLVMRGCDLMQIPTTLLAQVDSSVGGKTGIDTIAGKNTVGSFYQPRLVVADVALLDSLSQREQRAGYAEILKYGLSFDRVFFDWCTANGAELLHGDRPSQIHAVRFSCMTKARIVGEDEKEAGSRALLNFGHTFGHALETATGYGKLLVHGEAVAIGMVMALRLSVKLGLCPAQDAEAARQHLQAIGLPVKPPPFAYDIDRLLALMAQDKKAESGKLTLILSKGIGQVFVARDVDADAVRDVWKESI